MLRIKGIMKNRKMFKNIEFKNLKCLKMNQSKKAKKYFWRFQKLKITPKMKEILRVKKSPKIKKLKNIKKI